MVPVALRSLSELPPPYPALRTLRDPNFEGGHNPVADAHLRARCPAGELQALTKRFILPALQDAEGTVAETSHR